MAGVMSHAASCSLYIVRQLACCTQSAIGPDIQSILMKPELAHCVMAASTPCQEQGAGRPDITSHIYCQRICKTHWHWQPTATARVTVKVQSA